MKRSGFTVLELVIVIVVLALLGTLSAVALRGALHRMREVKRSADLNEFVKALEIYKQQYGDYPPDTLHEDEIRQHILKRWPKKLRDRGSLDLEKHSLKYWLCTVEEEEGKAPILDQAYIDQFSGKYAYFRANGESHYNGDHEIHGVHPRRSPQGDWYMSDRFQLFFAGEDGQLGTDDDISNFSQGMPVKDFIEQDK